MLKDSDKRVIILIETVFLYGLQQVISVMTDLRVINDMGVADATDHFPVYADIEFLKK